MSNHIKDETLNQDKIPTPRTDAEAKKRFANGAYDPRFVYAVYADFARQLERENAAMREAIREAHTAIEGCREDTCELAAERDWWKSEPRCGYSARWADMQTRIAAADAALAKLQPFINS